MPERTASKSGSPASPTTRSPRATSRRAACGATPGVGSLWALGVGAVISGDFFGWNFGLAAGGFGGLARSRRVVITAHVRGPVLQHRRDDRSAPAHGRRLLVRALGDGAVGRLRHGTRREHGVHPHALGDRGGDRRLSRRDRERARRAPRRGGGSEPTRCSSGSTSPASRRRSASPCSSPAVALAILAVFYAGAIPHFDLANARLPGDEPWFPHGARGRARGAAVRDLVLPRDRAAAARGRGGAHARARSPARDRARSRSRSSCARS